MCFVILRNHAKLGNMKVRKREFDGVLEKLLKAKPLPRESVKTRGKRGPKTPILAKQ
jgi:hypothetical protein